MSAELPRKKRLSRLDVILVDEPIYFVTACTDKRRKLLAHAAVHKALIEFANDGPAHGAWLGRYVLMPDHLHAFVALDEERITLGALDEILEELAFENFADQKGLRTALAEDIL